MDKIIKLAKLIENIKDKELLEYIDEVINELDEKRHLTRLINILNIYYDKTKD